MKSAMDFFEEAMDNSGRANINHDSEACEQWDNTGDLCLMAHAIETMPKGMFAQMCRANETDETDGSHTESMQLVAVPAKDDTLVLHYERTLDGDSCVTMESEANPEQEFTSVNIWNGLDWDIMQLGRKDDGE